MCLKVSVHYGAWSRQTKARMRNRIDKWNAVRARRRYLRQEVKYRRDIRANLHLHEMKEVRRERYEGDADLVEPLKKATQEREISLSVVQEFEEDLVVVHRQENDELDKVGSSCQQLNDVDYKKELDVFSTTKTGCDFETAGDAEGGNLILLSKTSSGNLLPEFSPTHMTQRLNENAQAREAVGESDCAWSQYLKDERIALFLQSDEFMHELRADREFMTTLQQDFEQDNSGRELPTVPSCSSGSRSNSHWDDATLRERISSMGKTSRKKFMQIAKVFSRRGRSVTGRCHVEGSGASHPLIDDDDNEEKNVVQPISEPGTMQKGSE